MDCGFESRDGIRLKYHGDEPDGRPRIRMSRTAQPCPGVVLRFHTVIDCTPGEEPMPPVTIEFVNNNNNLQPAGADGGEARSSPQSGPAAESAQVTPVRLMLSCDKFVALNNQLQLVEIMLAAADLPRECAGSVNEFCRLSAASATNMHYASMAVTVEAGAPGSVVDGGDEGEGVPDGADTEECAICYRQYVVGGATSVKLPCGHVYHRNCLDSWVSVNASCPYCRAPVPVPEEDCFWDEDYHPADGITGRDVSRSQPSPIWTRIGETAKLVPFVLGFLSSLARRLRAPARAIRTTRMTGTETSVR